MSAKVKGLKPVITKVHKQTQCDTGIRVQNERIPSHKRNQNLRSQNKDQKGRAVVLPSWKLEKIRSLLNKEEISRQRKKETNQKKEDQTIIGDEWKRLLHEADQRRQVADAMSELELEERERAQHLLEQANDTKLEQEEEIKMLNQLILSAQCQAGRDAQVLEKKQIHELLTQESKRLDDIMEADRCQAIETQKKIDELHKQQRINGREVIIEQIKQRQEDRNLQMELKHLEGMQLREEQNKRDLEDRMAVERKLEEQKLLQEEIVKVNAETLRVKELKRDEERQADMRALEYINNKIAQEAAYEAEQARKKKEKESETEKLRSLQQREKDYKAELDALRARRNQEKMEREWRAKQQDLAEKKAQEEAMLKAARLEQIKHKEHLVAIKVGQEKAEAERLLRVQLDAIAKQNEEKERQREKVFLHMAATWEQVKERERAALALKKEKLKEGEQMKEEARQRRIRLEEFKNRKLTDLKATGIPEKYCKEVERKARTNAV